MNFANRLKGSVTQALIQSLLADSGITIVPLGIEEIIREVSELDIKKYLGLNLPDNLRNLPDFFATNADRSKHWLLEVKFRKTWNANISNELETTLTPQVHAWSPLYLVIFFGETPASYSPEWPASWGPYRKTSHRWGQTSSPKRGWRPPLE